MYMYIFFGNHYIYNFDVDLMVCPFYVVFQIELISYMPFSKPYALLPQ
jgi:hypothetical protein